MGQENDMYQDKKNDLYKNRTHGQRKEKGQGTWQIGKGTRTAENGTENLTGKNYDRKLYSNSKTRRWTAGKRKAESDPLVGPGFLTTLQTPGK